MRGYAVGEEGGELMLEELPNGLVVREEGEVYVEVVEEHLDVIHHVFGIRARALVRVE